MKLEVWRVESILDKQKKAIG